MCKFLIRKGRDKMLRVKSHVLIIVIAIFMISGCSNTEEMKKELSEQITQLAESKNALELQVSSLTETNTQLQNQLADVLLKVDEYENGSQALLIKIRNAYESDKNEEAIILAQQLHDKFNGSTDDVEGQKVAKAATEKIAEKEKLAKQEEERKIAEAAASAKEKAREIIRVSKVSTGKPNSAGGVDLYINWKNNSEKTIKYAYFEVVPLNAVDDVVTSDIGRGSLFRGQETGPFKKGQGSGSDMYYENAWYNNTIVRAELRKIDIEYMDGTTVTLQDEDVKHVRY